MEDDVVSKEGEVVRVGVLWRWMMRSIGWAILAKLEQSGGVELVQAVRQTKVTWMKVSEAISVDSVVLLYSSLLPSRTRVWMQLWD